METWKQLSPDSLQGAQGLLREGYYRSSVSRSYYAVYCAATHEITQKITTFSYSWNNPPHEKVPVFVQNNLILPQEKKDAGIKLINTLKSFRLDADYRPSILVDEQIAKDCIRDAIVVQQQLWGGSP